MLGLRTQLLLLGAIALLVSALVGGLVAHTGLRSLTTISAQAAAIAAQRDFRRRLNLGERQDEVGQLARTVDSLLDTVEDTLRTHREFVADTSHELRNPLLAIRTNIELMDRLTDRAARAECRQEARQQVERMSRLVSDLLVLAQVEAGQLVERRPVALRPVVERAARKAEARARGQQIGLEIAADVELLGDEDRLAQVLDNLVANALRHTPAGAAVTLRLETQEGWACLIVADTGEGIPAEHLPHDFERFDRADKARPRPGGGTGLGLAIVRHLAEAHGGHVTAESAPGQGSRFTVWLPLRPGAAPSASAFAGTRSRSMTTSMACFSAFFSLRTSPASTV
jgi:two-component system OmpR family sensor kinase